MRKILASEDELKRAIPFLSLSWVVQNDDDNERSCFIYHCQLLEQVISLAKTNEIDIAYCIHRWYNYHCSKICERIFCELGAKPAEDCFDSDTDLYIDGKPFDIKVSVISSKYKGNKDLSNRQAKDEYIKWLKDNASTRLNAHNREKLFIIVSDLSQKCAFDKIREKVKLFIDYYKQNKQDYSKSDACEIIFVK